MGKGGRKVVAQRWAEVEKRCWSRDGQRWKSCGEAGIGHKWKSGGDGWAEVEKWWWTKDEQRLWGRDTGIGGRAVEQRCADGVVVEQGRKNGLV